MRNHNPLEDFDYTPYMNDLVNHEGKPVADADPARFETFKHLTTLATYLHTGGAELDPEKSEYTRGQIDLIGDATGVTSEARAVIEAVITAKTRIIDGELDAAEWLRSEDVIDALNTARTAWESQRYMIKSSEYPAVLNALTEVVVVHAGLPLTVDSFAARVMVRARIEEA